MSISFYIKNKRKILGYEEVLTVEKALSLSNKKLSVFAIPDMDINELLVSPLCTIFILSSKSFTAGCFPPQLIINIIIIPRIIKILFFILLPLSKINFS